jgi:5-methylcytosine-specific restriction endonuclease McrA
MTKRRGQCRTCMKSFPATKQHFYMRSTGRIDAECKSCRKARSNKHYHTNQPAIRSRWNARYATDADFRASKKASDRDYYRHNKHKWDAMRQCPKFKAKRSRYDQARWADPEKRRKLKIYHRRYHAERIRTDAEFRARLGSNGRAWAKANPDRAQSIVRNRRARLRGAKGSHTAADIMRILAEQNFECFYCHTSIRRKHSVDHRTPIVRGGSNWPSNLAMTCGPCNYQKGDMLVGEFRKYRTAIGRPLPNPHEAVPKPSRPRNSPLTVRK